MNCPVIHFLHSNIRKEKLKKDVFSAHNRIDIIKGNAIKTSKYKLQILYVDSLHDEM